MYFFRLYTELNAEMSKYQGDFGGSRSANEIGKEYHTFFTSDVHGMLHGLQGKEKIEAREQLCSIFQVYTIISGHTYFKHFLGTMTFCSTICYNLFSVSFNVSIFCT